LRNSPRVGGHATSRNTRRSRGEGLRTGEAMNLDHADVDLAQGMLMVRNSKFGKSRHLPLHPTTTVALGRYARRRDGTAARTPSAANHQFEVKRIRDELCDKEIAERLTPPTRTVGHHVEATLVTERLQRSSMGCGG